jgi:hypothetical protein
MRWLYLLPEKVGSSLIVIASLFILGLWLVGTVRLLVSDYTTFPN